MRDEFSDSVTKTVVDFATQVRETEDKFIFETIAPFCRNTLKRTISKKELEEIILRAERMKWIPCSERLPEFKEVDVLGKPDVFKTEKVFIQTKRGEMFVAWCHKKVWLTKDFNDEYLWYTHGTGGRKMTVRSKVVAWMPLPEPFKEEEHEQTN